MTKTLAIFRLLGFLAIAAMMVPIPFAGPLMFVFLNSIGLSVYFVVILFVALSLIEIIYLFVNKDFQTKTLLLHICIIGIYLILTWGQLVTMAQYVGPKVFF